MKILTLSLDNRYTLVLHSIYHYNLQNLKHFWMTVTKGMRKTIIMTHTCNHSSWETEAGGSWFQQHHGPHSETASQ